MMRQRKFMRALILLFTIFFLTACESKITTNTARTAMTGMPEETQYFNFTFKDNKLQEYNTSSHYENTQCDINYIDETHIDVIEHIIKKGENKEKATISTRKLLFDTQGKLIKLSSHALDNPKLKIEYTYHYDKNAFLVSKISSDKSNDIRYETNSKGLIVKEIYDDNSGFNLFIYEDEKVKAINFYDEKDIYLGAMIFTDPMSIKNLMLME